MSGNDNWEEFQDDLSDLSNIAGLGQRAETNRLLREQQAERRRIAALPDCPYCGQKLPKKDISLCGHCRNSVAWVGHIPCKNNQQDIDAAKQRLNAVQRRKDGEISALRNRIKDAQQRTENAGGLDKHWFYRLGIAKAAPWIIVAYLVLCLATVVGTNLVPYNTNDGGGFEGGPLVNISLSLLIGSCCLLMPLAMFALVGLCAAPFAPTQKSELQKSVKEMKQELDRLRNTSLEEYEKR